MGILVLVIYLCVCVWWVGGVKGVGAEYRMQNKTGLGKEGAVLARA